MFVVSISVYAVDTFTAINLLAFDRWAGQIKPTIPFSISRWIFAGCIILSFLFLIYRWIRAIRVMRQGGVAKSYLDPLAVRVQCIRMGKEGRGWKRFLVFAELTKSRKGADYVALFAHYSFEAWMRILFAEGPRQVVNALTLYTVMQLNLIPVGEHAAEKGTSPFVQFFLNIGLLAEKDKLQAVILFGMLWTLIIWVIEVLSLIVAVVLYLLFLWHHIPSGDGGLSGYCRKKINRRMERVVRVKIDKALKKENEILAREQARAAREGGVGDIKKQPTLPNLDPFGDGPVPGLSRQTTMTTLPEYTSRPQTARYSDDSLNSDVPPMPAHGLPGRSAHQRTATHASEQSFASYTSNAPLMGSAEQMGYGGDQVQTPMSNISTPWSAHPSNRSVTNGSQFSQRSFTPAGPPRPGTAQSGRTTPGTYQMDNMSRPGTSSSHRGPMRRPSDMEPLPPLPNSRSTTPYAPSASATSNHAPSWSQSSYEGSFDSQGRRTPANTLNPYFPPTVESEISVRGPEMRSHTPAGAPPGRGLNTYMQPTLPRLQTSGTMNTTTYKPYTPDSSAGPTPTPSLSHPFNSSYREYDRPPTAQSQRRRGPSDPQSGTTLQSATSLGPGYQPYIPPVQQGSNVNDSINRY